MAAVARRLSRALASKTAQVAELERELGEILAASELSNADDEHDPEGATIAFERQQLVAVLGQARSDRAELVGALARHAEGCYGRCEQCGSRIEAGRLEARPAARTCITCAS